MGHYTVDELTIGKLDYGVGAPACEYDGKTRYVRITDIDSEGTLGNDYVSPEYYEDKHLLHEGDILFARTGATVGKTYLYSVKDGRCVYAGFLIRAIPNRRMILPAYMYYFTKSPSYFSFVDSSMKVVAQPNINAKQYGSLQINVPDFPIQEKVVAILDAITNLISLRKKQLQKLDDLVKSRFVELFGDPSTNSLMLPIKPMPEVCEIIDGDRGVNYPKQEDFSENGYCLFLNAKNVTKQGFNFDECLFMTKEKDESLRKGKLKRGDVVLTTRGTIGNLAFYTNDISFEHIRINSGMVLLRMKEEINERFFIEQFKFLLEDIKKTIASGSAQPQLPISTMNKIKLLVPPLEKQEAFSNYISKVDNNRLTIQHGLDKLELLKRSLMQEYFV